MFCEECGVCYVLCEECGEYIPCVYVALYSNTLLVHCNWIFIITSCIYYILARFQCSLFISDTQKSLMY